MEIKTLDSSLVPAYERFLQGMPNALLYASDRYRRFLKKHTKAQDNYLLALDSHGQVTGAFPAFFLTDPDYGCVMNSLPFFGSNGAVLAPEGDTETRRALLAAMLELCRQKSCISATVITSPFEPDQDFYHRELSAAFLDRRIGQITPLPANGPQVEDTLMAAFDGSARRNIRKAMRSGQEVRQDPQGEHWEFIINTHQESMAAMGGVAKQRSFFELVPQIFEYGRDYRVHLSFLDGQPIGALLTFYFGRTVEYFTPVASPDKRNLQPVALLSYEAMAHGARSGYEHFNWGGTWPSQEGVYRFKKKWGAAEHEYHYHVLVFEGFEPIMELDKDEILRRFPHFYVVPFDALLKYQAA